MSGALTRSRRIQRARYRRWVVSRRRVVPRPVFVRVRAVGIVAVAIGIVVQSLAGWEGSAEAGVAPQVSSVVHAESESDHVDLTIPATGVDDVRLAVVSRAGSSADPVAPPEGWELVRRDDHPQGFYQAIYRGPAAAEGGGAAVSWRFGESAPTSVVHLSVTGAVGDFDVGAELVDVPAAALTAPVVQATGDESLVVDVVAAVGARSIVTPEGTTSVGNAVVGNLATLVTTAAVDRGPTEQVAYGSGSEEPYSGIVARLVFAPVAPVEDVTAGTEVTPDDSEEDSPVPPAEPPSATPGAPSTTTTEPEGSSAGESTTTTTTTRPTSPVPDAAPPVEPEDPTEGRGPEPGRMRFVRSERPEVSGTEFTAAADGYEVSLSAGSATIATPAGAVHMDLLGTSPRSGRGLGGAGVRAVRRAVDGRRVPAVDYLDVYPGIDLVYTANADQLEYGFVVEPGADPYDIALRFARPPVLDDAGNLVFDLGSGRSIVSTAPVAYQEMAGEQVPVGVAYRIGEDGTVRFSLDAYDPGHWLIIDPIFRSATSTSTNGAVSIAGSRPAGSVAGDLLLAQVALRAEGVTIKPPAGWTTIRVDSHAGQSIQQGLYYRVATGGEPPSYTWSFSSSVEAIANIGAYRGIDQSTPIDTHGGQLNPVSGSVTAPSITTTVAGTRLVAFFANANIGSLTPPPGMVERWDRSSADLQAESADEVRAQAGATGTRTAGAPGGTYANIGHLVALRPATQPWWFTVNSTLDRVDADPGNGSCDTGNLVGSDPECTLRAAIQEANASAVDEIVLPTGTYTLTRAGTLEGLAATGDLDITSTVEIAGAGSATTIIQAGTTTANGIDRVLEVQSGASLALSAVTIRHGNGVTDGAGIYNSGSLTVDDASITANTASRGGGGVYQTAAWADLVVRRSVISANAAEDGAGIANKGGTATVTDTEFTSNAATRRGGGFENEGAVATVSSSTFTGNTSGSEDGGAIVNRAGAASLTLTNSTVSGNSSGRNGGGVASEQQITIVNSTIAGNTAAGSGGGAYQWNRPFEFENTIIASNSPSNCSGSFSTLGHNLESANTCGFNAGSDLVNTNPLLGNLQDNGGATRTRALTAGSPAIDAGTASGTPRLDQRGVARVGATDIGAYEYDPGVLPPVATDDALTVRNDIVSVVDVLANDTDPAGETLSIQSVTQGSNGSVVNKGTDVTYKPDPGFTGSDSFTYTVVDDGDGTDTATVTVLVVSGVVTVNSTGDGIDAAPGNGVCSTGGVNSEGAPACTLRAAIQESNAFPGAGAIQFSMPTTEAGHAGGVWTISPASALPTIAQSVSIDGTTQSGWSANTAAAPLGLDGTMVVQIDGLGAGGSSNGLTIGAGGPDSIVSGLVINRFAGSGIQISATGVTVAGSYLGADPTGTFDRGNGIDGVTVSADGAGIGGIDAAHRNLISGNGDEGVDVDPGVSGTVVAGNLIGTSSSGSAAVGNGSIGWSGGVLIEGTGNRVGGAGAGEPNVIAGNAPYGVIVSGGGNTVQGNHIGIGSNGLTAVANAGPGIIVSGAAGNLIGGTDTGAGNVISGNTGDGIYIELPAATDNLVQGNLIGLGADGTAMVGNGGDGIDVNWDVGSHTIGGTAAGAGNIISGNTGSGIRAYWTSDLTIAGNTIGLDEGGTLDRGNGGYGVVSRGTGLVLGGSTAGGNVISGNGSFGVYLDAATAPVVSHNRIGTDAAGTSAVGNSGFGVFVSVTGATIADNVISGNSADGIQVSSGSTGVVIQGNVVGADLTGSTPVPNAWDGIRVFASGGLIGGTGPGEGNVIAFNNGNGITISSSTLNNAILGNSIGSNALRGIDLGSDGVTPNDAGDADSGANDRLNFPVISSAIANGGAVDVSYQVDVPAGNYRVEFFTSTAGDSSGYGEGETLVHTESISHAGLGTAGFTSSFASSPGDIVTATITEDQGGGSYGSTSEFSAVAYVATGTVTVNATGDGADSLPGNGVCDTGGTNSGGDPECTLRAAIQEANAHAVVDTIGFDIPTSDPGYSASPVAFTITPASTLPDIGAAVAIEGTTQPEFAGAGRPVIQLVGSTAGGVGLTVAAGPTTIRGLVINRFATGVSITAGADIAVVGSYLGPDVTGQTGGVGNTSQGLLVSGTVSDTVVGGTGADRNVVSGNRLRGIWIDDFNDGAALTVTGTRVVGNLIGTDAAGLAPLPYSGGATPSYQQIGVAIWDGSGTSIGGSGVDDGNVISGNSWYGVYIWGPNGGDNTIRGNIIGLDGDASLPVANGYDSATRAGILLSNSPDNMVGGVGASDANVIAGNASKGVVVSGASATNNSILGNHMHSNTGVGLDLAGAGVTVNDAGDVDSGANDLLNFPEISSAVDVTGTVEVSYDLDVPAGNYRVEFFTNTVADSSGHGEGETLVSTGSISHAGAGAQSFAATFGGSAGDVVTATVTEDLGGGVYGSTSEFSEAIEVSAPPTAVDDAATVDEDTDAFIDVAANDTDPDGDTVTVSGVTDGANGTVVDNGDGTVTYIPDVDWNGTDSFTYTVSDGRGGVDTAAVSVTVTAVNDAPVAVDDADAITEDGWSKVDVVANDDDVEGDGLSIDAVTQGSRGSVVDNGDGTLTYTPDADWNGVDSFTYTVTDGFLTDTATVTVTVAAVNDVPVAADDNTGTDEDTVLVVDPLDNDSDVDGDSLSIESFTQAAYGVVVDNGDGTVTYTPDADWNGTDGFKYTVTDGVASDTATVWVVVAAVNDAPVAAGEGVSTDEDAAVVVDVLVNDSDVDGDVLSVDSVTQGADGSVTDNGDGTVTYTPDPDFVGVDSFTYTVTDGFLTDTATVSVVVGGVNDAPVAGDDTDSIFEDGAGTVGVLANDSDVDGDVLSVDSVTQGADGSVVDNGDGTVTYTPDPDFNGVDSFTYTVTDGLLTDTATVTVTVTAVNDFPVAVDDAGSGAEDGSVTIDVLVNDSDVDGDVVWVLSVAQPVDGVVTDNGDGTLTFTPDPDWNGVDTFSYVLTDGALTDTVVVTVTVSAVNDAPVAVDDADTISEDGVSTVDVVADDVDVDGVLSIGSVTQGSIGSVTDNGDGTLTYTPDPDWNGVDSFTYTVTDGSLTDTATVTVTVTPVNDPPVATDDAVTIAEDDPALISVLANDTDVDGDTLWVLSLVQPANGTVSMFGSYVLYTPDADWHGVDSFSYVVSDGALTDTATVTVTVTPVNEAPAANDDFEQTYEDTAVTITVLGNDTDVDGDALDVTILSPPGNGGVVVNGDGTVTYTPDPDWNGMDSFTYDSVDPGGLTDSATVTVLVHAVNDAPVAADDADAITEDGSSTLNVVANDTDVDGAVSVVSVTQGVNGSVVDNGDGTVTYTPDPDWFGTDSYSYTVSDGALTDSAAVTVVVTAVNDAPVAADDADAITEDGSSTLNVVANDTDVDGAVSVVSVTQGANGVVVDNGDGTVTYTPDADWNGVDSFTYTISDGALGDSATVTVTVTAVNDAPVATVDNAAVAEDGAVVVDPVANDTDVDADGLSLDSFGQGADGIVTDNGDGTLTYTPDPDWNGTDNFNYTVTDGVAADTATVWVVVAAVNDAPVAAGEGVVTDEDTPLAISVLVNDFDVDGDMLSVDSVTQAATGTVIDNGDGTITYTPGLDWNGIDSFTYTITDGAGGFHTATVVVSVGGVNDAPVALDDADTIPEDGVSTVDVLADDSDVDGDPLLVAVVTQGGNGTVVVNGDGTLAYTPDADWNGVDSFTYTVTDGLLTDTATVTVTVSAVNDFPVGLADTASTFEDSPVIVDLLGNDGDVDGDVLAILSLVQPGDGWLVDNGDGTVTYTPDTDWNGADSFVYTVTDGALTDTVTVVIVVSAVNDDPVAADDAGTGAEDGLVVVDVINNDSDVDGDVLSIAATTQGADGSVNDNGDGTVTYTPDPDWNGTDTFTVTVSDGVGGSATSAVTVMVAPVNDAPVTVGDATTLAEDTPTLLNVGANDFDVDGDPVFVTGATTNRGGTASVLGAFSLRYTPALDFTGVETITYTLSDGAVSTVGVMTVTVLPVNDTMVAVADSVTLDEDSSVVVDVLANDVDVDGDMLSVVSHTQTTGATVTRTGQQLRFVPDADRNGVFQFTYTTSDGASASVGIVTVTVRAVNDVPVAFDDTAAVPEDDAVTVDVLANDTDVDGDRLTVSGLSDVADGTATVTADGRVRFVPAANFNGIATFRYTASDGSAVATARVSIGFSAVNDAPVISQTSFVITRSSPAGTVVGTVTAVDPEGSAVVFSGSNDRLTVLPDGTVVLARSAEAGEILTVLVVAMDSAGESSSAWATVNVGQDNRAPIVADRSIELAVDFPDGGSVIAMSAVDPDGDAVTWSINGGPGWDIGAASGVISKGILPAVGQTLAIPVTATDPAGLSDTGLLTILVVEPEADNRPPVATNDFIRLDEDQTGILDPHLNDLDPDGDALTAVLSSNPVNGDIIDDQAGVLVYKPVSNWYGTEQIAYRVSDGRGGYAEATITIVVEPVNDPPLVSRVRVEVPAGQISEIPIPQVTDVENHRITLDVGDSDRATVALVGDVILFTPEDDSEGSTEFFVTATDELGATGRAPLLVDVIVGKTSVSVEVLSTSDDTGVDLEEAARIASPGGLALFMPNVTAALAAVWASRIPLVVLLALLALSLFASRRLHIRLGTTPLKVGAPTTRTWSVVLIQEGQTLSMFAGPDRSHDVIGRLHPLRCDLAGTGELSQTGGVIWVEINGDGNTGWVEASHVIANPRDPLPMSAVANALEQMVAAVRGETGLQQWISGRGLFVSHHAPPFRLTRKRVEGAMVDPTPFRWWNPRGQHPELTGSFADVVVSPLLDALVHTAAMELSTTPIPGEVLYEFTNFEHIALGTPQNGWILCFERGLDGTPLLVGLMKRGAVNPASLVLELV